MGCIVSWPTGLQIPNPPITDYDFLCTTAKQKLTKVPQLNTGNSFFYMDRSHRLWKMKKNPRTDELRSTYNNNFRVFLLPNTTLLLKPLGVLHVKPGLITIMMLRAKTDMFEILQENTDFECILNGLVQVSNAIAWLHEHGLAHRDIKPENIVFHEGRFKLIDFDFCSPLEEFVHCGTEHYMCSKSTMRRWKGSQAMCSKRADVYAFGKTILFILWHACRQHVIPYDKRLHAMFHGAPVVCIEMPEPWQHWLAVAVKCCSKMPPVKIPLLPLTIKNTLTAVDSIAVPTSVKVVDADPAFAEAAPFRF